MDISEFNGLSRPAQSQAPQPYTHHVSGRSETIPPDLISQWWNQASPTAQSLYDRTHGSNPFVLLPPAAQSFPPSGVGQVPAQEPFGRGSTMLGTPPPFVSSGAPSVAGPASNVPASDVASMVTALRGQ